MRTHNVRIVHLLAALALFAIGTSALAGCGGERADGLGTEITGADPAPKSKARARQVAAAWDGSTAAAAWRKGYYPMGDTVQLPERAFRNDADKRAYGAHNFVLHTRLPTAAPKNGHVKWESGGSLTLPLTGARTAYEALADGSGDGPHLTVTGAELGETSLLTSRGRATVPAWLFTVKGYDTPLKQVALSPSKPPAPPIKPAADLPSGQLWPLGGLVEVAADGRSVTVIAQHGACDDGPAVHVLETDGSVVLYASMVGTKDGACTAQLIGEKVTVKLDRPAGDRVLLDAFTGRPVPYGEGHGYAPNRS
ncbi:hypothetical protein [Streptomyces sp. SAS_270]|uniref:hypothetical protein n=1 Tax=Streptomyces sp. SAS_270 TaxID=3412748 RepID=UPI00403C3A95